MESQEKLLYIVSCLETPDSKVRKYTKELLKDLEILEIIKEKVVDIGWVITYKNNIEYNEKMVEIWKCSPTSYFLTQQEFSLIKEWLEKK